ncbi:MarR family winged helix-turn-helix transcriptional regulator [Methanobrevibacter sp. DSM 116169]|uniref:MarR family winged helix-turn-helix transcriptional regulator n=1 Tax=Methanobrevibacter sp. DSM 116169 TaxID=3242727 RepID=UPI0038FC817D
MNYNEKIDKIRSDDSSMRNLIGVIHKTHKLYIAQKVKNLDISPRQIPFILKLNSKEKIYQKDLIKKFHHNKMHMAMKIKKLYDMELIERKIDEDSNDEAEYYITLTSKGKDLASKLETIENEWEEMIYNNLETSNKEDVMNILKDLSISCLKTNQENNIKGHRRGHKRDIFDKIFDGDQDSFYSDNRFRGAPDFRNLDHFHKMKMFDKMCRGGGKFHHMHGDFKHSCKDD